MGPRTIDRSRLLEPARSVPWGTGIGSTRGIRVCIDGDGWVTYRCRADDTEIVGGVNVNPREVERLIIEDDAVAEAAVVGVRESTGASALQAFLVPTSGAVIDESVIRDIHRRLLTRLSAFKVPHRFAIVERLPRTANGKLLRGALRAESPTNRFGNSRPLSRSRTQRRSLMATGIERADWRRKPAAK